MEEASLFRTNTQHFSQDYASEEASLFRKQPFQNAVRFAPLTWLNFAQQFLLRLVIVSIKAPNVLIISVFLLHLFVPF